MALAGEPGCGFDAVNVTVTKIRFNMSATAADGDPGWTEIAVQPPRRINIAQMNNGAIQTLATAILPPGHFAQTRLVLDANSRNDTTNSVVVAGTTTEVPLQTQTVAQGGIAVGPGFDLANGQTLNLIADFDACRSVVPNNGDQYLLSPSVTALPTAKNGINGFVATSLLGSHVRVTAQQNGVIVRATSPDPSTGEFNLSRLDPGSYDVVVTADGRAASVVAAVPVASTVSTTALNSAAAPISMQPSATGHLAMLMGLNPVSSLNTAFGSASQKFASGPSVVIGYRLADLTTNKILFSKLPMGAPLLAVYSATSALSFTAQPNVTPAVAAYQFFASAPGYTTLPPSSFSVVPD